MDPQRPSNSGTKSASLILKQLKEAAKAAEDVDDYYDTEEDEDEDEDEEDEDEEVEEEEEEEEIVGWFGFPIESNDGKVTKKKKLVSSGGSGKRGNTSGGGGGGGGVAASRCQVEKCGADLSEAKRYYKRHKVCEAHAKSPLVVVDGIRQRFCQQCSRFFLKT